MGDMIPDYSFEIASGARFVAGVDEVGRGPWAGPVTAAAVILDPENIPDGLNDSKKLSAKKREALFEALQEHAIFSVAHASVQEIDQINILNASHLAMTRAIDALPQAPDHMLIDGNRLPKDLRASAQAIIKGDGRSLSIAAASIIAKVTRDRLMDDLGGAHPGYGWETNRGYGTAAHRMSLLRNGVTPHHRRSFKPIHNILCANN